MQVLIDTANRDLQELFYRCNYAVFRKDIIDMMGKPDTASWGCLMLQYSEKWPLASRINYQIELNDSLGLTDEAPEAIVIPCSLIYSMPEEWQANLLKSCLTMQAIKEDENEYFVHAGKAYFDDPFKNRHRRWTSDSILDRRDFDPNNH